MGKLNNVNATHSLVANRNKEFHLHLEYSGDKNKLKAIDSLNTTDIELQGGELS